MSSAVPSVYPDQWRCALAVFLSLALPAVIATAQPPLAELQGDPGRGEQLYTSEYKCYACHGYDAQTGEHRLKPMNYTQEGFIILVQNSPLPQMPAYQDAPAQDLADVYAYVQSIPVDAPELEQLPVLRDILDRQLDSLDP